MAAPGHGNLAEWTADDDEEPPGTILAGRRAPLESRLQAESGRADRLKAGLQRGPSSRSDAAPPSRPTACRHREVLIVSIAVVLLAFALVEVPGGRVAVRGLLRYPLPTSCVSRSLFGVRCPGCGLTRAFVHLAEGDWSGSWRSHRLGGLLAAVVVFQIPYRLLALRRPESPPIPPRWSAIVGAVLIVLLIVNWLADVVTGRLASL